MNPGSLKRFSIKRMPFKRMPFKRMIAKLYIDRSVDCGKAPPVWVSAFCEQDTALSEYERRARWLAAELRSQADAWAESQLKVPDHRAAEWTTDSTGEMPEPWLVTQRPAAVSLPPTSSDRRASGTVSRRLLATAALLVLAAGAWFAWGVVGFEQNESTLVQQSQNELARPNSDAALADGGQPKRGPGTADDRERDPLEAWRPMLASAAATEEVFRRVSNGTRHLLSRTLASTTELGLEAPLARAEEAREALRERGAKLRQTIRGMSAAISRQPTDD